MNDSPREVRTSLDALSPAPVRELSLRAIVLGLSLSVVMAAANVYLGLYAGMTVSASIPAAVVGMILLRGLFRNGTILEANQVQTAASAGESLAAGIIFTLPALVLIGAWTRFDPVLTALIGFTGGLLGILLMIPMRRVFVADPSLPFPEGVACATVLETADRGATGRADATNVFFGGALGAVFKLLVGYVGLLRGTLESALVAGGRVFFVGADASPALLSVGFIVGANVSSLLFVGGALGWLVLIPLHPELEAFLARAETLFDLSLVGAPLALPGDPIEAAYRVWSSRIRYVGVGTMAVAGLSSIWRVRVGLVRAVRELRAGFSRRVSTDDRDRDLPPYAILGWTVVAVLLVGGIYLHFTGDMAISTLATAAMLVMTFFFVAVASYIVGLVGNSNSPVSGMTITAVLFTGGLLYVAGFSGMDGMLATLGVAAVVCCAACTSGDVCNDLKTGQLVGASPRRQQIMQIGGVLVASLVMGWVLELLHRAYGIGSRELPAPQATLFANLARGFFGDGNLPWGMVGIGAVLGIVLVAVDGLLARRGSAVRVHPMPVAVGVYLPFGISAPMFLGGLLSLLLSRGATGAEREGRLHRGVLFASGAIAGESLTGVLIAALAVLAIRGPGLGDPLGGGLTALTFVVATILFYRFAKKRRV